MRLRIDEDACTGHGRCYALAPGLFDADDYGHGVLRADGDVPAELAREARLAVDNCPERAISLDGDGDAPGSGPAGSPGG
jgi:ferredoxin